MPLKPDYPWNVLVLPAASEIGLEIHRALRDCKEVVLHGANQPGENIAAFHFQRLHALPPVSDPDCLSRLQALIAAHSIDAIFPAHDDAVLWLAQQAAHVPTTVIGSPLDTSTICRSKRATYEALRDTVPVPSLWEGAGEPAFPLFVKPDRGQGSQRARRIDDRAALDDALAREPDLLVMEHLPGAEYTVDCFSASGKLLFAMARERLQTKSGIATLCRPVEKPEARDWAARIATRLDIRGAWFFQMKADAAGHLKLLEVAPRIAGSMALSRAAGPNFPLLSLYDAAGHTVNIESFPSTMRMGRSLDVKFIYDQPIDALYLDYDDTLIVRGAVNTRMVALLFQCRNRGIPVYLLTHHRGDLAASLAKFRLAGLFDRIIHVPDASQPKAGFIAEKNAVLIDDSHRERAQARRARGIRCFDAAGALCLFDDRA